MQTILGSGGAIGIELARALKDFTSEIRLVSRNPKKINETDQLLSADLTERSNIFKAVEDCEIVYVTVGFDYDIKVWQKLWPPFIHNVVDACIQSGAKLVFFDNVYAIGGDNVRHITEKSPLSPTSRKGQVRAEVDRYIIENFEKGKISGIIARSPDFFGGPAEKSLLMNLVYNNLIKGKKAQWFCNANANHTCGYTPDLAKGMALLGNTKEAYNQVWNLPTDPQPINGKQWISLFAEEMDTPDKYTVLPSWMIWSVGLFVPVIKEMYEMRYQFDRDYFFDSSKFLKHFNYSPVLNKDAVKIAVEEQIRLSQMKG